MKIVQTNKVARYIVAVGKKLFPLTAPGIFVFLILFAVSVALNLSISYMGNSNDAVARQIISQFWGTILIQIIRIVIVYCVIGAALSFLFARTLGLVRLIFHSTPHPRIDFAIISFGVLLFALLLFFEKLIINPQLYIENFSSHAAVFAHFQLFLTDHINPLVFTIPVWTSFWLCLCAAIGSFITKERIQRCRDWIYDFRYTRPVIGSLIIVILVIALYQSRMIFYTPSVQPNIIIIASDALRPDHFSGYGYSRDTTSNIDAIARESAQFRGVMTAVPRTFPSWVSILTSQYPLTHNIKHMFPRTRERNVELNTAGRVLGKLGYVTSVVSDFAGDIFPRIDLGFQQVFAPDMNFSVLVRQIILEKQTFLFPFITNSTGGFLFPEMKGIAKYTQHEQVTDKVMSLVDSSRGKPFFITTFYSATHFPFAAPYPYYQRYAKPDYAGPFKYYKQVVIQLGPGGSKGYQETVEDKEQVNALYDGCLNLFDREVGKLYRFLKQRGLLDNTIIVITSDHGENLYDLDYGMGHGEHLKGAPVLEVPLIIRYPKIGTENRIVQSGIFSSIDIIPTLFDCAGIPMESSFQGRSLISMKDTTTGKPIDGVDAYSETGLWFDNNKNTDLFFQHNRIDYPDVTGISEIDQNYRREIVIQQRYQNITNAAKYRAIFAGGFKLIYIPLPGGVTFELYDQINDPLNTKDLSSTRKDILEIMKKRFYEFVNDKSSDNFVVSHGYLLPVFSDPIF